MPTDRAKFYISVFILLLSACADQAQTVLPAADAGGTPAVDLTDTAAGIPTGVPPGNDPLLFGAVSKSGIDPLAAKIHEIIFATVMDGYIAGGNILEYQVLSSEAFPANEGTLIAEIHYNVRTRDPSWLVDGGAQADGDWITNKCSRFDLVNTETEFQLRDRRTCN